MAVNSNPFHSDNVKFSTIHTIPVDSLAPRITSHDIDISIMAGDARSQGINRHCMNQL